jgi:hypothetical protein
VPHRSLHRKYRRSDPARDHAESKSCLVLKIVSVLMSSPVLPSMKEGIQECEKWRGRRGLVPVLGFVSQNCVWSSCPPGALKQHRSSTTVVFWQLNSGFEQVLGPGGKPVGELVGAEVVVLVVSVLESEVAEVEVLEEVLEIDVVEVEEVVAMQVHALLTRLATLPVHAATAYDGIALAAVTGAVVKVPQNDCASASLLGARSARRQLSALQFAATTAAAGRTSGRRREERRVILTARASDKVS